MRPGHCREVIPQREGVGAQCCLSVLLFRAREQDANKAQAQPTQAGAAQPHPPAQAAALPATGKTLVGNTELGLPHPQVSPAAPRRSLPALGSPSQRLTTAEPHSATVWFLIPTTSLWAEKVAILMPRSVPPSGTLPLTQKTS